MEVIPLPGGLWIVAQQRGCYQELPGRLRSSAQRTVSWQQPITAQSVTKPGREGSAEGGCPFWDECLLALDGIAERGYSMKYLYMPKDLQEVFIIWTR